MRRLVRESGDDLPLLLLHAACDAKASGAPDARRRWTRLRRVLVELQTLHERARRQPLQPLLDGRDVMAALNIPAGPEVGRLLARVLELQEAGRVSCREEALSALPGLVTSRRR
jgi:hypothetical protein